MKWEGWNGTIVYFFGIVDSLWWRQVTSSVGMSITSIHWDLFGERGVGTRISEHVGTMLEHRLIAGQGVIEHACFSMAQRGP